MSLLKCRVRIGRWAASCVAYAIALAVVPSQVNAQANPPTVVMQVAPAGPDVAGGLLVRELVRQAVLITAREEFGLVTRDVVLGETPAKDSKRPKLSLSAAVSSVRTAEGFAVNVRITHQVADQPVELKTLALKIPEAQSVAELTTQLETLSRQDLIAMLEQAGLKRAVPAANAAQGTPEATAVARQAFLTKVNSQLERWSTVVQFAAVRSLHGEIRKSGATPELLAALARGYANLGTLTEVYWSPAHKVFKARALLYADRLVNLKSDSAALQTRAYVRGLVGLPLIAFHELTAAAEKGAQQTPKIELSVESQLIKDYCVGNSQRLAEFAGEAVQQRFARYLNLLLMEHLRLSAVTGQAASLLLELDPSNLRAMESMVTPAPLGVQGSISRRAPEVFAKSLPTELAEIPNLPKSIQKILQWTEVEPASQETVMKLTQALVNSAAEGAADQGSPEDLAEPSLVAVGHLIREINYLHAFHIMSFQKSTLGVNSDDTLAALLPVAEGHAYLSFLKSYIWDKNASTAAEKEAGRAAPTIDIEGTAQPLLDDLEYSDNRQYRTLFATSLEHDDVVFRDLVDILRRSPNGGDQSLASTRLFRLCPDSSLMVYFVVTHNWDLAQPHAVKWEQDFAQSLPVQEALARQYLKLKRLDDAERCLKRRIELMPDYASYKQLSALYLEKDDEAGWIQSRLDALELPSQGLESAQVHDSLARHYMQRNELEIARTHADAAAQSGAGWAMHGAAQCHELLGEWEAAEKYVQGIAERYEDSGSDWYCWCRRTGHGDLDAARTLAKATIVKHAASDNYYDRIERATFQYAEGEDAQALATLQALFNRYRNQTVGVQAALLAEELKQPELRDKLLLNAQRSAFADRDEHLAHLIQAFRADLRTDRQVAFDVQANELHMHRHELGKATQMGYFIGKFLLLRGRTDEGTRLLKWAATSPTGIDRTATWATLLLIRKNFERGPLRHSVWAGSEPLEEILRLLNKHDECLKIHDRATAAKLVERALKLKPDSADALFARAFLHHIQGRWDDSITDYQKGLELVPNATLPMLYLARSLRSKSDFPGSIAVYERALKAFPDFSDALVELIPILDSSEDDKIRNGKRALELAMHLMKSHVNVSLPRKQVLLAEALAETGDFPEAIRYAELALKKPPAQHKHELNAMLEAYRQKKPFRRQNLR